MCNIQWGSHVLLLRLFLLKGFVIQSQSHTCLFCNITHVKRWYLAHEWRYKWLNIPYFEGFFSQLFPDGFKAHFGWKLRKSFKLWKSLCHSQAESRKHVGSAKAYVFSAQRYYWVAWERLMWPRYLPANSLLEDSLCVPTGGKQIAGEQNKCLCRSTMQVDYAHNMVCLLTKASDMFINK